MKRLYYLLSFGIAIAVVGLYATVLPNSNPNYADSDELIAAAKIGGVPHPPGYPLYIMLAGIIGRVPIPILSFAGKVNLLSSVFHALTVVCVFWIIFFILEKSIESVKARVGIGIFGATSLATTYGFWLNGVIAEVFPLNNFLAALITLLMVLWERNGRKNWYLLLSAGLFGLGLSNQQAIVVIAPMFIYWVLIHDWKVILNWRLLIGCLVIGILAIILPYTYVFIASAHQPLINWENVDDIGSWWRLILRQAYAESADNGSAYVNFSTTDLSGIIPYLHYLFENFSFNILFALSALVLGFLKDKKTLIFLLLGVLGGGMALSIYQPINYSYEMQADLALTILIGQRFYLLSLIYVSILIAVGLGYIFKLFQSSRWRFVLLFIPLLILGVVVAMNIRSLKAINFKSFDTYGQVLLKNLEPNAVLLTYSLERGGYMLWYEQVVNNVRPDVKVISGDFGAQGAEQFKKQNPGLTRTTSNNSVLLARDMIRWNIGKKSLYVMGINVNDVGNLGLAGNPYFITPVGCGVYKVTKDFKMQKLKNPCADLQKEQKNIVAQSPSLLNQLINGFYDSHDYWYEVLYKMYECTETACPHHKPVAMQDVLNRADELAANGDQLNAALALYTATMLEPQRLDVRKKAADFFAQIGETNLAEIEYADINSL